MVKHTIRFLDGKYRVFRHSLGFCDEIGAYQDWFDAYDCMRHDELTYVE